MQYFLRKSFKAGFVSLYRGILLARNASHRSMQKWFCCLPLEVTSLLLLLATVKTCCRGPFFCTPAIWTLVLTCWSIWNFFVLEMFFSQTRQYKTFPSYVNIPGYSAIHVWALFYQGAWFTFTMYNFVQTNKTLDETLKNSACDQSKTKFTIHWITIKNIPNHPSYEWMNCFRQLAELSRVGASAGEDERGSPLRPPAVAISKISYQFAGRAPCYLTFIVSLCEASERYQA